MPYKFNMPCVGNTACCSGGAQIEASDWSDSSYIKNIEG